MEKNRLEEIKEKHEVEKANQDNRKKEQKRKERMDWNDTLKGMLDEKRQKSADEKEKKKKREQEFERKQAELKGLAESKAAAAAAKEKETQIKVVADLIMHEKKIKDKMQNREMALKQKIDVANHVTKVAEEKCILMKEGQKKRDDEVLNEYINKVQERKKQVAQNTKRITEDKETAKERLERIKDE